MNKSNAYSRRSFLAMISAGPIAMATPSMPKARGKRQIPIGLELYSVRNALKQDLIGTVRGVAGMGFQCVEFYAPYYAWTPDYAKQVRAELDELGIQCHSTHNDMKSFGADGWDHAMELNKILGTRYIVLASPGRVTSAEGWKRVADALNQASQTFMAQGFHAGYHNHDAEWHEVDGQLPMEILAANTDKSIMLQLDVGTCLEAGHDPVAWIQKNPSRIHSLHLKDWSAAGGYKVLFGEGVGPWRKIFAAAEKVGGVEYYLIEQEGSQYSEMETVQRCLAAYRKLRAS